MDVRSELLEPRDAWTRTRRRIAALAGGLATQFAILGMRQYGVIRHLPDPPIRGFDSDAVLTSRAAYPFGVPDSALAVTGLGAVIALATAGGSARSGRPRWLDGALALGAAGGAAGAVYYLREMIMLKRWCAYCLVSSAGMFAIAGMTALGLSADRSSRAGDGGARDRRRPRAPRR
jgi:uncharacterized membrane protein